MSAHYEARIDSVRSAADTFDYLARFDSAAEWDPGVVEAAPLDGADVREGSRFRLVASFAGRRLPMTYTVRLYARPREVVLHGTSRLLRAVDRISVEPRGEGSVVTYSADVSLNGPLKVLEPLLAVGFRRTGDRAAAGLRARLSS